MSGYTKPGQLDLTIWQGDRFRKDFQLRAVNPVTTAEEPVDLTPHQIEAHIRQTFASPDFTPFEVTITNAAEGRFELSLTSSTTRDMLAADYVWDCEIIQNGDLNDIFKIMVGKLTIKNEVTVQGGP